MPDDLQPAYVNPAWSADEPGTFAVIIGVSQHYHLPGGSKEIAPKTFNLTQLTVGATTAFKFFDWLRTDYQSCKTPLAKCWLLISPTPHEIDHTADLSQFPHPTLANCHKAINQWFEELRRSDVPDGRLENSKAIFFFTGHGLEVVAGRQVLLPCDYLAPRTPRGHTISTSNIMEALAHTKVLDQIFIFDACRNDNHELRGSEIESYFILDAEAAGERNRDIRAPALRSTGCAGQAFMPRHITSRGDTSFFAQELLRALKDFPPGRLERGSCHDTINVYPLQKLVNAFLNERFQELNIPDRSPVRIGNEADDVPVTEQRQPGAPHGLVNIDQFLSMRDASAVKVEARNWNPMKGEPKLNPHQVFQHEYLVELFKTLEVWSAERGAWLNTRHAYEVISTEVSELHGTASISLAMPTTDQRGYWIQFHTRHGQSYASAFPGQPREADRQTSLVIKVAFDFNNEGQFAVSSVDTSLDGTQGSLLGQILKAWNLLQMSGMQDAWPEIERLATETLFLRDESYIAAIIAGIILLKRPSVIFKKWWDGEWLCNLAHRFHKDQSDARILWAEQLLRQNRLEELDKELGELEEMPLPIFVDTFATAYNIAARIHTENARKLRTALEKLAPLQSGNGLTSVYSTSSSNPVMPYNVFRIPQHV
jgi:hypothetical protein